MVPLTHLISAGWPEAVTFMLVFGRAGGLMISAPFWGSRVVPVVVRVWIAILLAVATYPTVRAAALTGGITILSVFFAFAGETLLGLVLGWLAQLMFSGMRLAGQRKNIVARPERLHEQVVAVHGEEKQAGDQFEERAEKTALAAFIGVNELDQTEA